MEKSYQNMMEWYNTKIKNYQKLQPVKLEDQLQNLKIEKITEQDQSFKVKQENEDTFNLQILENSDNNERKNALLDDIKGKTRELESLVNLLQLKKQESSNEEELSILKQGIVEKLSSIKALKAHGDFY